MSKVVVTAFSLSLDGFGAGPDQSLENPIGVGGRAVHEWLFATRAFHAMAGFGPRNAPDIDNEFADASMEGKGAWILGRNMFGPVRGPWPDDEWKGWWGDEPPYHCDVFVLTHHPREPIVMQGGTTFHFVTDGIHSALERARASAGDRDIRIGGGVETIRQYLEAGLIDEMHLVITGALIGRGEHLLHGIDLAALGYVTTRVVPSEKVMHVVLEKRGAGHAPAG